MFITGKHGPGVDGDATVSCLSLGNGWFVPAGVGTDAQFHPHLTPERPGAVATGSRAPGALHDAGGPLVCRHDGPAADALPAPPRADGPVGSGTPPRRRRDTMIMRITRGKVHLGTWSA